LLNSFPFVRKEAVSNAKEGEAAKKAEAISMQSSGCAADHFRFHVSNQLFKQKRRITTPSLW